MLSRLPIIGSIYGPVKQFTETLVSAGEEEDSRRVVLAEYPPEDSGIFDWGSPAG